MSIINNLFPPILNSSQPAFDKTIANYIIYFELPSMMSSKNLENAKIQIKITKQSNNKNIANLNNYPNGIIEKKYSNSNYVTIIKDVDISPDWEAGTIYKIQMRFVLNEIFSEWSTVMITKAITAPMPIIANGASSAGGSAMISTKNFLFSTNPLIIGKCPFVQGEKETVNKYRFTLYDDNNIQLETSDWLQHNASEQGNDSFRFGTKLINQKKYGIRYEIISNNGYTADTGIKEYEVQINQLPVLKNITLLTESNNVFCKENACIQILLNSETKLSGNYVLTRTSEKSNFTLWEDLRYFLFDNEDFHNKVIFNDFAIENGVEYQYAFQQENSAGLRTAPICNTTKNSVNFEYSYLYADDLQLKLKFNNTISSFKHVVLSSKMDTIGSKYPTIFRNGNAYYSEFPISGLITLNMDDDKTFFTLKSDGYYFKNELVIPNSKIQELSTTDLTNDNFYIEKIFRDKVEEFLNNGKYKLFKSATEGNIVIALTNVTLTPNKTLGRMIYEFSATAYEIADFDLKTLNTYNIINIGSFNNSTLETEDYIIGQVQGLIKGKVTKINLIDENHERFWNTLSIDNLLEQIKSQINRNVDERYSYNLLELTSFWVERYPVLDFQDEILELQAKISDLKNENKSTSELEKQILYYDLLKSAANEESSSPVITINLDSKQIRLGKNKVYHSTNSFNGLNDIILEYSTPIIFNYIAKVKKVENTEKVVQGIDTTISWGQIAGIFSSNENVLENYNYHYNNFDYEIPNIIYVNKGTAEEPILEYSYSFDNSAYNLYKTENIFDVIKNETKKQVEKIYNTQLKNYDEKTDTWDDGSLYYNFNDIINISIEARKGTTLKIRDLKGVEKTIIVGPTERYTLNPSVELISYLTFEDSAFAIIDYKCSSIQTRKGAGGGN